MTIKALHVNVDRVAIDSWDWALALSGDKDAKERIKASILGVDLYYHFLSVDEGKIVVPLADVNDCLGLRLIATIGEL